ncbi:hypothetical protein BHE90_016714 [Fusarium euwallaceae]|uniref:3-hydroxyisobutyrate dehydrogenase n=1 Tax=Fusarium euwallaceae TaxID=1147111 RepID=A0A430KZK7_9HYPO|nr:hypothetical protein BHE90_016714 [Fusarium euwallaceae]
MPSSDILVIQDIDRDVMSRFHQETTKDGSLQVELAQNARELAEKATVIITCLPSPPIVKELYCSMVTGHELPRLEQERLFIDTSTIDPPASRSVANLVHNANAGQFVDAPVSGGAVGARAGTLSFMYGAPSQSREFLHRVESILSLMGERIWHMGEQGCGVASKLANNYILAVNNIAVADAMSMGHHWGLDLKALSDLISHSTGRCWPVEVNNPVPGMVEDSPASNDYRPGCPVSMINKDLRLAMVGARASGASIALADKAHDVYNAVDGSFKGKDFSVVYQWLLKQSERE